MASPEFEQPDSTSGDVEFSSAESENSHNQNNNSSRPSVGPAVGLETDERAQVEEISFVQMNKPKRKMKKPTKKRKRTHTLNKRGPTVGRSNLFDWDSRSPENSPKMKKRKFNHSGVANISPCTTPTAPNAIVPPIGGGIATITPIGCPSPTLGSTSAPPPANALKKRLIQLKYQQASARSPSCPSGFPQPIFQMTRNMAHAQSIPHTRVDKNILIKQKKLFLILDIDHTLVHTFPQIIQSPSNSPTTASLSKNKFPLFHHYNHASTPGNITTIPDLPKFFEEVYPFHAQGLSFWIKLRPHCKQLIKELSENFIIAFYTQGKTGYAKEVKKILDPENKYIMGGVLGQTVKQEHKSIVKFVQVFQHTIPRDMLLVADDRLDVWQPLQRHHVLPVKKFEFWPLNQNGRPLPLKIDALRDHIVTKTAEADQVLVQLKEVCLDKHRHFFTGQHTPAARSPFTSPKAGLPQISKQQQNVFLNKPQSPSPSAKQQQQIFLNSSQKQQRSKLKPDTPPNVHKPKPTTPPDPELMKKWMQD